MRRRRPLLLATALAAALAASSPAPAPGSARAGGGGEIVFASARANIDPGEIYALGPGKARHSVFHSPYAEVALATSPKGRALAFWSDRSGAWRLMVSPDGVRLHSVVVAAGSPLDAPLWPPVFSPDGRRLLIPFSRRDAIAQVPQLAVADVASGRAASLTTLCGLPPAWSPDGRSIACADASQTHVGVVDLHGRARFTMPGKFALWSADGRLAVAGEGWTTVLRPDGRVVRRIEGVARAWSPDGKTLALTRPGALVLAPRSGRARVVGLGTGVTLSWVAFTPDGRDVVYAGGIGGAAAMVPVGAGRPRAFRPPAAGVWARDGRYAAAVTASAARVVLADNAGHAAYVGGPMPHDEHSIGIVAWLGDGSRLLYDTSYAGRPELWTMRANGGRQLRLAGTPWPVSEPAWSADGTKLAYSSAGALGRGGIVIAGANGKRLSVVPGDADDGSPSWSPNGTQLAVANDVAGGVTVLNARDGARTDVAVDGVAPAWSPDGSTIAFVDLGDGSVWGSAPNGAGRHRLLPGSIRGVRSLAWSPDGKLLAFGTDRGISVVAPDGTRPGRPIVAARLPGRPSFSPDGTRIAFAAQTGSTHPYRAIFVVGVDGRGLRQLTKGPYDSGDPAWRP